MSKKNKQFKELAKEMARHSSNCGLVPEAYSLASQLYPEYAQWLDRQFYLLQKQHDTYYEDNFRIAEVGDAESEREYVRAKKSGCCGRIDEIVKHPKTGREFMLGFNYGH